MGKFFKNQGYHFAGYVLIGALLHFATVLFPAGHSVVWGLSTSEWILAS